MARLLLILGDQLHPDSPALRDADADRDTIVMAEVAHEAELVPNHRQRLALFFSAMRHWADARRADGWTVRYQRLDDADAAPSLPAFLARCIESEAPEAVVGVVPGRRSLMDELTETCREAGVGADWREDDHFLVGRQDFADWLDGRKRILMGDFYRAQRKRLGILLNASGEPEGGRWSHDADNRASFGIDGPQALPAPVRFAPDATTAEVIRMVERLYPADDGPMWGSLDRFEWPVTARGAQAAADEFIDERLPHFGTYQDAIWSGEAFLYHSLIAPALNLKLLDPRDLIARTEAAYREGRVPLNAAEGFIRQILGWREYMRGMYWARTDAFLEGNALDAHADLPGFYWTGDTDMACVSDVVHQLLDTAYAHHIQRLMVTGLFAQLLGVAPRQVHAWYIALYADSAEWVTLPNTVGMSQWADGGLVATKPYVASGAYIDRQSNYCGACRYHPKHATGDDACPFTTLYWDFLDRHRETLSSVRRMNFQLANLDRKDPDTLAAIGERAAWVRQAAADGTL